MDLARCYEVLGVRWGASADEVRDAYRSLVKTWHPDRFNDDPEQQRRAERRLAEINEAFRRVREAPNEPPPSAGAPSAHAPRSDPAEHASAEQARARRNTVRKQSQRARAIAANLVRRWARTLVPAFGAAVAALGAALGSAALAGTWLTWPLAAIAAAGAIAAAWLGRRSAQRYRDLTEQLRTSDYAMCCPHCGSPTTQTLLGAPGALDRLAQSGTCEQCGRSHWLR